MRSVPVKNQLVEWKKNDNGEVCLTIPRREALWLRPVFLVFSVPKKRRLQLDEIGSEVWEMCDGRRTVGEIIQEFARAHKLNRKETEVAMLTYLRELVKRRLLGLQVPLKPVER